MLIYIVRHGLTPWNHLHKAQGSADIPLAQEGIDLARKTGEALRNVNFDVCFTSPLTRAEQTARLVLGGRDIPVIPDKRIQEINFGALEGHIMRTGNTVESDCKEFDLFFRDPLKFPRPENGENIQDVLNRTRDFWLEKTTDPSLADKTVLVSSHGCAVRALLQNLYQDPEHFWHGCVPPNCSINLVEVKGTKARFLEEDKVYA